MDDTGAHVRTETRAETDGSVLAGGLLVIGFGLASVLMAILMGWVGAAALGVVLLAVAWKVPTSASARVLRPIMAGFGVVALLGAIFDLFTQ